MSKLSFDEIEYLRATFVIGQEHLKITRVTPSKATNP